MSTLPETHEKDYLALLIPYVSEEQNKSRRNIIVSSFIILSIHMLERSLTDIKLFGINLNGSSQLTVILITACLITYWLLMYLMYYKRDYEIRKEQEHLLISRVKIIKNRMEKAQSEFDKSSNTGASISSHWRSEFGSAKSTYAIYENQLSRTKKAGYLNSILRKIELYVPIIMAMISIFFIVSDVMS